MSRASAPSAATLAGPGLWARLSVVGGQHPQLSSCWSHRRPAHQTPSRFGRDLRKEKAPINRILNQALKNISKHTLKVITLYPSEKVKLSHCMYSEREALGALLPGPPTAITEQDLLIPTTKSKLSIVSFMKISLVTFILKESFPPQRG